MNSFNIWVLFDCMINWKYSIIHNPLKVMVIAANPSNKTFFI